MTAFHRTLFFSVSAACLTLALGTSSAQAACDCSHHAKRHHHAHSVVRHHGNAVKISNGKEVVRTAQEHLANLGYYGGKIDGVMGPQTKEAIKHFQYDKRLKVDGILGPQTKAALEAADQRVIGTHAIPLQNIVTGPDSNVSADYVTSLNGGTQPLSSRFGRIDVTESGQGADKRYNVNLNGQALLTVDGQPSVIGMSSTYDLGNEDAIIFTTFGPNDNICPYKTHVLAIGASSNQMLDVGNCTRDYQARVNDDSLYIVFPEHDDNRAVGATWRVEGMTVERL